MAWERMTIDRGTWQAFLHRLQVERLNEVVDVHLNQFRQAGIAVREFGKWTEAQNTAIYRFFNASGGLLYVGITDSSVRSRIQQNHRRRNWWPEVVRIEVTYGYTRREAEICELAAIRGEQPLHNVAGNSTAWPRRGGLNKWEFHAE